MYYLPEYTGKQHCKCPVDDHEVEEMRNLCEIEIGQNSIYIDYFESVMHELQLETPKNENEALDLFVQFIALQE